MMKKVAIIGFGGLGVPAFLSLIKSSLHITINIYDEDKVDISNLHRQIVFNESHVGFGKLDCLEILLKEDTYSSQLTNKDIKLNRYNLDKNNLTNLLNSDCVLDCTDDPTFKFLLNDFCKLNNIPLVHGGAQGESGLVLFVHKDGPCLRCIFGDPEEKNLEDMCTSCRISGILGAYSGLTGLIQAETALEYLGDKQIEIGAIKVDSNGSRFISFEKNENCILCSTHRELNLGDIKCPETFVYTKLALLKRQDSNEKLLISFGSKDSLQNVEKSILEEGYTIYKNFINQDLGIFKLMVG